MIMRIGGDIDQLKAQSPMLSGPGRIHRGQERSGG